MRDTSNTQGQTLIVEETKIPEVFKVQNRLDVYSKLLALSATRLEQIFTTPVLHANTSKMRQTPIFKHLDQARDMQNGRMT